MAGRAAARSRGRPRDAIRDRRRAARAEREPVDGEELVTSIREELDSNLDDRAELERLRAEVAAWREAYEQGRLREIGFGNSEREVEPLYTPLDVTGADPARLGVPGRL